MFIVMIILVHNHDFTLQSTHSGVFPGAYHRTYWANELLFSIDESFDYDVDLTLTFNAKASIFCIICLKPSETIYVSWRILQIIWEWKCLSLTIRWPVNKEINHFNTHRKARKIQQTLYSRGRSNLRSFQFNILYRSRHLRVLSYSFSFWGNLRILPKFSIHHIREHASSLSDHQKSYSTPSNEGSNSKQFKPPFLLILNAHYSNKNTFLRTLYRRHVRQTARKE